MKFDFIGLLAASIPIACSGSGTSDTSAALPSHQSAAVILTPDGGGPPGSLVVHLPTGLSSPPPKVELSAESLQAGVPARSIPLAPGVATDLAPGAYCVLVRSWWSGDGGGTSDCSVQIRAGATTTYTLSAFQVTFDAGMLTTVLGRYASASVSISRDNPLEGHVAGPWTEPFSGSSHPPVLVTAGRYVAQIRGPVPFVGYQLDVPATGTTLYVAQDQVLPWPITIPEWRFRVHVVPPSRQLPNAPFATPSRVGFSHEVQVPYTLVPPPSRSVAGGGPIGEADFDCPTGDMVLPLPPASGTAFDYTLSVYGLAMPIPAGSPDTEVDVRPGRIDVADVPFTKRDGTSVAVRGTWRATRRAGRPGPDQPWTITSTGSGAAGSEAVENADWFETHRGVDVIPGTYDVTVDWDSTPYGGQPQEQRFTATF